MNQPSPLSNVQLELLKVFSSGVSETELLHIRKILGDYFAEKVTSLTDKSWDSMNYTAENILNLANEHNRTPYRS